MLALQRVSARVAGLRIDELDRSAAGCVVRTAPAVVNPFTRIRIPCISSVQSSISTADDVDTMHEYDCRSTRKMALPEALKEHNRDRASYMLCA